MKANSRRRVLISSLAMLLVALVALSTATYAWFTSSTTATAKGLNVKTAQASELEISDYTKGWGTQVNYAVSNKVLLPVSSADGANWWQAAAASKTNFAANSDGFKSADAPDFDDAASSSYVYKDQLNVKNSGEADVEGVKIEWTIPNFTGANYLRVALVPANAQGVEASGDFAKNVYDKDGVAYNACKTATTQEAITPKTTCSVTVGGDGKLSKDETYYYNLYVWFEGQDEQCIDGNAGQIISDIEFTVTGTTASQS